MVGEAEPSPPPGPARDALAEQAAARVERAEQIMTDAATAYAARVRGVVLARLQGPKARKHTRHWTPAPTKVAHKSGEPPGLEVKALDPEYIVPDSLVTESVDALRSAAEQVARESATDAADRVAGMVDGPDGDPIVGGDSGTGGMFEIDADLLADLIAEALEDMTAAADRHADRLRDAIEQGESGGADLDELLDGVEQAEQRSAAALARDARTTATALAGKAVLDQARALGVTHVQWISRRDERVRLAHRRADGQVRALGDMFDVGGFALEYPGDPSGLPATASQVHNCRCGLLLADVDAALFSALDEIADALADPDVADGVDELFDAARASRIYRESDGLREATGFDGGVNLTPAPADVVGWRTLAAPLDAVPGQVVDMPADTVFALAPPETPNAATLAVRVPRGTLVGVADGAMTLPDGARVTVLADGGAGVQLALF